MRIAGLLLVLIGCGRIGIDPLTRDASDLPFGLIAWYTMDGIDGGNMLDASGHHHDGACELASNRCPGLNPAGQIGNAYVFDGFDDILKIDSTPEFMTTMGFTVSAWFNVRDRASAGCFINKGFGDEVLNSWQACLTGMTDGMLTLSFISYGTADTVLPSNIAFSPETWHHVALTWDAASELQAIYIDGGSPAIMSEMSIAFDGQPITFGSDVDGGRPTAQFPGSIDEVQIYNHALLDSEIRALAQR
jgi:hypothetical protein